MIINYSSFLLTVVKFVLEILSYAARARSHFGRCARSLAHSPWAYRPAYRLQK